MAQFNINDFKAAISAAHGKLQELAQNTDSTIAGIADRFSDVEEGVNNFAGGLAIAMNKAQGLGINLSGAFDIKNTLQTRIGDISSFLSEGLGLEDRLAAGIEALQTELSNRLGNEWTGRISNLADILGRGLSREELFAKGAAALQAELTSRLCDEWAERLEAFSDFINEGLSREEMIARGVEALHTKLGEHLGEEWTDRLAMFKEFKNKELSFEEMVVKGKEFLQTQLTEHLCEELVERVMSLKSFYAKGIEMAEKFADKQEYLEAKVALATQGSIQDRLTAVSGLFGNISDMLGDAAKENRTAAIAQRAVSIAQATINSLQAGSKTLATVPFPANIPAMAAIIGQGIATVNRIRSTPIPSAETGGRFIVPDVYPVNRVDSALMRVNPGEEVNVTPRGNTVDDVAQYIFQINDEVIFDVVSRGIRTGKIRFEPAANL